MVEWAGLENRNTRKRIVGSNPTLSASYASAAPAVLSVVLLFAASGEVVAAQRALAPNVESFVAYMAREHQFEAAALRSLFAGVKPRPAVLRAVSAPATARPWHEFRSRNVDPARIKGGVAYWRRYEGTLARASREYGVPEEIIVATIGIETVYGRYTGSFAVLEALTTLAFHYPPRAALFRSELESFLLLVREGGFDPRRTRGSYAGAIGIPQFLPSSYRRYAVDFDGDGKRNLARTVDAIGSVANYYRAHGWEHGSPVIVAVEADGAETQDLLRAGIKPRFRVSDLLQRGLRPAEAVDHDAFAALIRADTEEGPAYWMAFKNFYVITRYNRSVNYALAVHELAGTLRSAVRPDG